MGIAATMRSFNSYNINLAKTKIFNVVQDLEMQQFMNNQRQQLYIPIPPDEQNPQNYGLLQHNITDVTSHDRHDEQPQYQNR